MNKPLVPGSFAAWGRTFLKKQTFLLNKPLVPGSFAAWGRFFLWDSCVQNKTSEISKNALSGILGLLCVEQDVGNINKWTFRNSGTPGRRPRRRKSKKINFQEFWDSCAQNYTSEFSTTCSFRNSRTPVRRTRRRKSQKLTFRNSGTPVRRTRRRRSKTMTFSILGTPVR